MAWGVSGWCLKILKKFFLTFLGLGTNVVKVSSVNSELLFQWDTLMDTNLSNLNKIEIVVPTTRKACVSFGLLCSYCEQGALHPSPQNSDWSSEDWDSTKAKAMEQSKSLIDFNVPKPKTSMEQTMNIDKVTFSKLQIGQSDLKEEPFEVMTSLIPLPPTTEASGDVMENTDGEGLLEVEKRL